MGAAAPTFFMKERAMIYIQIFAPDAPPIVLTARDIGHALENIKAGRDQLPPVFGDSDLDSVDSLRAFIDNQPPPSGVFDSDGALKDYLSRWQIERDARLVQAAQDQFSCPDRRMTEILGLRDKAGDGSPVRKIRARKNGLSGPTRRALAYAIKYGPMTRQEETEVLNGFKNGHWRDVTHADLS